MPWVRLKSLWSSSDVQSRHNVAPNQSVPRDVIPAMIPSSPMERVSQIPKRYIPPRSLYRGSADLRSTLPPWKDIVAAAELYLLYCDCQPLPLFNRDSFIVTLETRDPEVLLSMLALASRFSEDPNIRANLAEIAKGYVESARALVNRRLSDGPIELSTLQTLCLLSLVDFTSQSYRILLESRAKTQLQTATHDAQV